MDYIVYARTNSSGYITHVNSSAFLTDTDGWTEIGRGSGDRYLHAQNNYLGRLRTNSGAYRWKLADGQLIECSAEEIAAQEAARPRPEPGPTDAERYNDLIAKLSEVYKDA